MNLLSRQDSPPWLADPSILGMIHLPALPGSPEACLSVGEIWDRVEADAQALANIGFSGLVIENFGDKPFLAGTVESVTVAVMSALGAGLRERFPSLRIVVNCLRNDAEGALAVAVAASADAIRINVHTGAVVADQGVLTGRAADTLRRRRQWGAEQVRILADVRVKHSAPLAVRSLEAEAADMRLRGLADVLLLTGEATGHEADLSMIDDLRKGAGDALIFVASGVDEDNATDWAGRVDGAIVGSSLMREGRAGAGIDPERARRVITAWSKGRTS